MHKTYHNHGLLAPALTKLAADELANFFLARAGITLPVDGNALGRIQRPVH